MRRLIARAATATFAVVFTLSQAQTPPALSAANFVEIGDGVSGMLDTSGLAFSTMLMDSAGLQGAVHATSFNVPSPPALHAQEVRRKCPGGGQVEVDMLDADASGDLSAHDRFKLIFGACAMGREVISGRSEFVVAEHRFEGAT